MKVARLDICDTFGIKEFHLEPKTVTFIRGTNGVGKSSIFKAVLQIFEGGKDPGIIRRGAKRSVVVLTLDDGHKIEKITTPGSSTLEIIGPDGLVVPNPATFLKTLAETITLNPSRLLRIDASTKPGKKALMEALLETMPVEFTPDDMANVAPLTETKPPEIQPQARAALAKIWETWPKGIVNLDGIEKYRRTIEESRRKIGQEKDECNKGADALAKSIPAVEDGTAARERLAEVVHTITTLQESEHAATLGAVEAFNTQERVLRDNFNRELTEIQSAKHRKTADIAFEFAQQTDPLKTECATLRERIAAADKAAGAREQIEKLRDRYREHAAVYELFTEVLRLVDAAKAAKLEHLPIPGLTFYDGDVLIDGVRWQDVNTAKLVEVAIQHAALRPGSLNSMFEDDAEHLAEDTRKALTEALIAGGWQVIFAEVKTGEPLTIETRDHA